MMVIVYKRLPRERVFSGKDRELRGFDVYAGLLLQMDLVLWARERYEDGKAFAQSQGHWYNFLCSENMCNSWLFNGY
jgi:hypothetical protein